MYSNDINLSNYDQCLESSLRKMSRNYRLLANEWSCWREVRIENPEVRSFNWGKELQETETLRELWSIWNLFEDAFEFVLQH
jgi:hypothetical protein